MRLFILIVAWLLSGAALAQQDAAGDFVDAYAKKHDFDGTILVQDQGRVRYLRSFGWANRSFKVPSTPDTKYKIASITKLFTAVLVLQLYEQGRIDLHKPIRAYLPDYPGEGADRVTVHQLLNHTSGIANFDTVKEAETAIRDGIPVYQLPHTSDQLLARFGRGKLVHPPGTVFDYDNGDYIVLGKIVERVSGVSYEHALKERILAPLHLADTGMLHQSDIVDGLASTYFYRDDLKALANDLPVYPENWYAAGGMYSNARDLLSFANALFAGRLIRPDTLARMTTPGMDDYGYGAWSYETRIGGRKTRVFKRPGQIMGAQTQLYRLIDEDLTVVILSNTGNTDLDEFVAAIGRQMAAP